MARIKPVLVAIRVDDETMLFEFPSKAAAKRFLADVRKQYPTAESAQTVEHARGSH